MAYVMYEIRSAKSGRLLGRAKKMDGAKRRVEKAAKSGTRVRVFRGGKLVPGLSTALRVLPLRKKRVSRKAASRKRTSRKTSRRTSVRRNRRTSRRRASRRRVSRRRVSRRRASRRSR